MAIDFEAIKSKLERLKNNERDTKGANNKYLWKPKPGEYVIRVLPWPDAAAGEPFKEIRFYTDITRGKVTAPDQFGHADPVKELRIKLFEDGAPALREYAKKLFDRPRGFALIVVRGEEADGPKVLDMNKTLHQEMMELFFEDGETDYINTKDGFDVKVTVTEEKMDNGNTWYKLKPKIPRSFKSCPATKDPKQLQDWLATAPDLTEIYPEPSYDEIKSYVDAWLNTTVRKSASVVTPALGSQSPPDKVTSEIDDVFAKLSELDGVSES